MFKTLRFMLLTALTMLCGSMMAEGTTVISEDFENLTLVDADGNALANSWSYGYGLSNGWQIKDGSIFGSAGSTNYGYVKSTSKGHDNSNGYLEASYSASNSAYVFIPVQLTEDNLSFWAKSTSSNSSTKGKVIIYEANADGTLTTTKLLEVQVTGGQAWDQYSVTGVNGKYVAINMVRAQLDDFVVFGGEVAEPKAELEFITVNPSTTVKLENGATTWITFKNTGNADATGVKLNLYVDNELNNTAVPGYGTAAGIVKSQANGSKGIAYDVTKIQAGNHQVYFSLTADNADDVKTNPVTVTFTQEAPQATFSVTAQNLNVAYNAENYEVVAQVSNTSQVDATDVKVELYNGTTVLVTKTIPVLNAGATEEARLMVTKDNFEAGTTYNLQVMVEKKASCWVNVTIGTEPVAEVKDLAITEVVGTIELANATNSVRVSVVNNGNVDITDAVVTLKAGENVLGTSTVSATKNGGTGYCMISVASEGLEAGELNVTATVEVEGDATPTDNTKDATLTVNAIPAPVATFTLTAENVTVTPGQAATAIVKVTNTSTVDAKDVEVKILYSTLTVATQTVDIAAGETKDVEFSVTADQLTALLAQLGGQTSVELQAVADKSSCFFTVSVQEVVTPVVDMALTQLQGITKISLSQDNVIKVWYKNNGNVATTATINATLNGTALTAQTVENVAAEAQNHVEFTLPVEGLTAGETATFEATIAAEGDTDAENNTLSNTYEIVSGEVVPAPAFAVTVSNVKVLTTDAKVKVVVNVKNTGDAKAAQAEVKLLNGLNQIGDSKWIFGLEAGAEQNVTFEFNNFDKAGTYQMQAWVTCGEVEAATNFDVIVNAPVAILAIESIEGTINLANTSSRVIVAVKNNGTANATNAKATLSYGETTLETTIQFIRAGETGYAYFMVPSEGITGETLDVTAKVEYDEKTVQQNATLTVQAAPAAEATFSVTADENVTVAYNAASFEIKATVKNTSAVDAENVEVKLTKGIEQVGEAQTIAMLAAGAEQELTFTVTDVVAATYYVNVNNNKAIATVNVTVESEPVANVVNVSLNTIQGISNIDLAEGATNTISVWVNNEGNVDADATINVTLNGTTVGEDQTVNVKAGKNANASFTLPTEGLVAGEKATVVATVTVAENTAETTTMTREYDIINSAVATEPVFSVTAENVTVANGAISFDIVAKVKNTSTIDATNVEVKLFHNTVVDTKTIESLVADAEETVTFTVNATEEAPFVAGTTATYYVQAPKAQAEVIVTFEQEAATPVTDMALTALQGISQINLKEENKVQVWYKNEGNVTTSATIYARLNGNAFETKTVQNVKADGNGYVEFTLPTTSLTAGETATFEAEISAQGDNNAENNILAKELTVISGETEPQAEIMINPIRGWNVSAGEQQVSVTVSVFNQGDADAKDVKIELYKSYGDGLCEAQTVDIAKGGYKMLTFKFNYTFEEGKSYDFHVFTNYADGNLDDNQRTFTLNCPAPVANVTIAKIAKIEATTADEVKIAAKLKNNSDFAAKEVKVGVYKAENLQYQLIGFLHNIEEIAAGEEADVEFNLGQLEAGNYTYYVRVMSVNGTATTTYRDVEVKVTEAVADVVEVALIAIQGISQIDLAAESNTISVWMENTGNVAAEANVSVKIGETELDAQTTTVAAGNNGYVTFTLPTDGLTAGTQVPVVATLTVADNTSEAVELTKVYDVVNSTMATEAVFEVTAAPVEVEFGAEKFTVKAVVKNTSAIDATNVEVNLFHNGIIATQTIASLAGGTETEVTFTDVENPFTKAGEYTMYVQAPKAQAEVKITVKPEPVVEKVEVALIAIQGISNIDLAEGATNTISVWAENTGNMDAEASISVTLNGTAVGEAQTITLKAGRNGGVSFELPTEGLTAGTKATVVATVTVDNNTSETTTLTREYDVVNSAVATEPVYEISAAPVEVEFGAEKFNVTATVKNTNNIAAENVAVSLFYNGVIATQTVSVAANATTTVTFNDVENPFTAAGTYTMYVQAPNAQAEVAVTVKPAPVEEKTDLAITAIQGSLSLDQETNYLTVFVNNMGTIDVTGATVTLTAGETVLGTATVSAKAGDNGFCSVAIGSDKLQAGEFTVVAKVEVEGDADLTNNEMTMTYTIAAPTAQLSFAAEATISEEGTTTLEVKVTVKNESTKADAENVAVTVYDENSAVIGEETIAKIAAGTATTVTANCTVAEGVTSGTNIQVLVAGCAAQWVKVVKAETTSIEAIKAMYGENVQIYTLSGKKVNNVQRGVYVINGNVVVIK